LEYKTPVNTVRPRVINTGRQNRTSVNAARANRFNAGKPQHDYKGFVDSGCSKHMTGNIAYLSDFKQFDGGYVAFGGDKGKGIMIEPEVPLKRKDQIALDEQIARDIQAKLDAELLEEQSWQRNKKKKPT
ncbi:hypothetical protein Tco_0389751, partial [Tanacetum coccineum]